MTTRNYDSNIGRGAVSRIRAERAIRRAQSGSIPGAVFLFPGLGSLRSYASATRLLPGTGSVRDTYEEVASAFGDETTPEKLEFTAVNTPHDFAERQSFLALAMYTYNLALFRRFDSQIPSEQLTRLGFAGESLGIIAAAAAGGVFPAAAGARIAHEFPRIILDACAHAPLAQVVAIIGSSMARESLFEEANRNHPGLVEIHKHYSPRQDNIYVFESRQGEFAALVSLHPEVNANPLKSPTRFLAHSQHAAAARSALDTFLLTTGVAFQNPVLPIIRNDTGTIAASSGAVRESILALTDTRMDSRATAEKVNAQHSEYVVELGLGRRGLDLMVENSTESALLDGGSLEDIEEFASGLQAVRAFESNIYARVHPPAPAPAPAHVSSTQDLTAIAQQTLRTVLSYARRLPAIRTHLATLGAGFAVSAIAHEGTSESDLSQSLRYSMLHFDNLADDDVVLDSRAEHGGSARSRVWIAPRTGPPIQRSFTGHAVNTQLIFAFDATGQSDGHELSHGSPISSSDELGARSQGFNTSQVELYVHARNELVALAKISDVSLYGLDQSGWILALIAAEALPYATGEVAGTQISSGRAFDAVQLARILGDIREAIVPLITLDGFATVRTRDELIQATRHILVNMPEQRPVTLTPKERTSRTFISLGIHVPPEAVSSHTYIGDAPEGADTAARAADHRSLQTREHIARLTLHHNHLKIAAEAEARGVLKTSITEYIHSNEIIRAFGSGGSESMAMILETYPDRAPFVRKVLNEHFISTAWNRNGIGTMISPVKKAERQSEYLHSLPSALAPYFPRVLALPARTDISNHQDFVYDMSYMPGIDLSEYVLEQVPPPDLVAKCYEVVQRFLSQEVHTHRRRPSTENIIIEQYVNKIDKRLALSFETAPLTFGPSLTRSRSLLINGRAYRNWNALRQIILETPEFIRVLEPQELTLVVGDTNTENVRIRNPRFLSAVQARLETLANGRERQDALNTVSAATLDLGFLDPRAIGFHSAGAGTVDDPMYDAKMWHNSLGHYDEIHHEFFTLSMWPGRRSIPTMDIRFTPENPFALAYGVGELPTLVSDKRPSAFEREGIDRLFAATLSQSFNVDFSGGETPENDPHWLIRFVFTMGSHFLAMPPFHFSAAQDSTLIDTVAEQSRPVALYAEGIKWMNWSVDLFEGSLSSFLGIFPTHTRPGPSSSLPECSA